MNFRELRIKAGKGVTEASGEFGIKPQTLYKIEQGRRRPSRKLIKRMKEVYGCEYAELFEALGER